MGKDNIVLLSTADWDNPFWTNKQHVAVELAKRGHSVFYIESLGLRRPTAKSQDVTRIIKRLGKALHKPRRVRENLWVWSPVVLPFQSNPTVRQINWYILNTWLNFWLKVLGIKRNILWTYNPLTCNLIETKYYNTLVYHCVDEIKAQPGMPVDTLEQAEKELTAKSDLVFVTAPKLYQTRKEWNANTYYFPNVADYDHFAQARDSATTIPADLLDIPGPRIGFVGAISGYKVDFELLKQVAVAHPEWSLVLIGKVGEGDPLTDAGTLKNLPNVHFLGPRSYQELPNYLKGFDVALLPNVLNEYTESMFPMKFFEYLAAGKKVVSVNLSSIAEFSEAVYIAKTREDFVTGISQALADSEAIIDKALRIAKDHTYTTRTDKMMSLVKSVEKC